MPRAGFETTIPASEQTQPHALDRAATGIIYTWLVFKIHFIKAKNDLGGRNLDDNLPQIPREWISGYVNTCG